LKRKSIIVPQEAPSCCSSPEANSLHNSNEGTFSEPAISTTKSHRGNTVASDDDMDMDQAFGGMSGIGTQASYMDQYLNFDISSEKEDSFQWLDTEKHATASQGNLFDFAASISAQKTSTTGESVERSSMPYQQHTGPAFEHSLHSPNTNSQVSLSFSRPQSSSTLASAPCRWGAPPFSNSQQQGIPSPPVSTATTPATPSETTIRLEGADPETLSAVMALLIQSKARFQYETR